MHASGQAVQFFLDSPLPQADCDRLHVRLNKLLPSDLRVLSCRRTPPDFSARLSPTWREYHYRLTWGDVADPLRCRYHGFVASALDVAVMQTTTQLFEGTHDFAAFSNSRNDGKPTVRTLLVARCVQVDATSVRFEVRYHAQKICVACVAQ